MTRRRGPAAPLAGTAGLLRLGLRSGWAGLAGVVVLVAGLVTAIAGSIEALYPTLAERQQYAESLGVSAATQAFNGRGYALATVGGITVYEVGFIGQLLFPFLALHLALRHTRREEEAGRTELLTAARVGRLAPLLAGILVLAVTLLVLGVLMVAGAVATGLPAAGATWYASGTVALMAFFGGTGLLLGQLAQSARTGYLAGLAVITAAFLTRALVDGLGWEAVWLSPLGWSAELRAFGEPRTWPLVAYGLGAALLVALAGAVASRRDLGAGVLAPRRGPAHGRARLGTVTGLAWRLNAGGVVTWAVLAVVWAGVFGLLTEEMTELVDANPALLEALGVERGSDVVTSLAVVVVVLAATAVAVQGYGRLAAEESSGRLGALLATRTARGGLWLRWWVVVALASVAVLAAGCLSLGLTTWAVLDDGEAMSAAGELAAGYAVPVVFVSALAAAPRALGSGWWALAWLLVGWIAVVGFLAETLRVPDWARDLSPVHLVGTLPQEDADLVAVGALAAGGVALLVLSVALFRRRDLAAG